MVERMYEGVSEESGKRLISRERELEIREIVCTFDGRINTRASENSWNNSTGGNPKTLNRHSNTTKTTQTSEITRPRNLLAQSIPPNLETRISTTLIPKTKEIASQTHLMRLCAASLLLLDNRSWSANWAVLAMKAIGRQQGCAPATGAAHHWAALP